MYGLGLTKLIGGLTLAATATFATAGGGSIADRKSETRMYENLDRAVVEFYMQEGKPAAGMKGHHMNASEKMEMKHKRKLTAVEYKRLHFGSN